MKTKASKKPEHGPIVPLTTVDAIVRELKLDRVDFIKMDIEGAEVDVLEDNAFRGHGQCFCLPVDLQAAELFV